MSNTAIKATPEIMIVGIIEGEENIITLPFKEVGDDILIIGETKAELGGSEYHSVLYNLEGGTPPKVDETQIKARWNFIQELYKKKLVKANHDVNKGGFIITIGEMCFKNELGVKLDLKDYNNYNLRDDELLFSETVGRFIIETNPKDHNEIMKLAKKFKVYVKKIGILSQNPTIEIKGLKSGKLELDVLKMKNLYKSTIPNLMEI